MIGDGGIMKQMHTHSSGITVHNLWGLCWWHVGERFQRLVVHNADLRLKSQTTINVETLLKTSCTEDSTLNSALSCGSSKQGKALLASVGWNWVAPTRCSLPSLSFEQDQFNGLWRKVLAVYNSEQKWPHWRKRLKCTDTERYEWIALKIQLEA